jgi:hypothetical protein
MQEVLMAEKQISLNTLVTFVISCPKYVNVAHSLIFYFIIRGVGWDWVHLVRRPLYSGPTVRDTEDDEWGAVRGMRTGGGNLSTRTKAKPAPLLLRPPKILWPDLGWNLGGRGGKPATNLLSYSKALLFELRTTEYQIVWNISVSEYQSCTVPHHSIEVCNRK